MIGSKKMKRFPLPHLANTADHSINSIRLNHPIPYFRQMDFVFHFILLAVTVTIPLILIYQAINKHTAANIVPLSSPAPSDLQAERQKLILNAYERLALLCDRIQPDKLAMRLQTPDLSAQELSQMMIVTIQQEFDHNITQQIFVSEPLWNILSLSKDEALYEIIQVLSTLSAHAPAKELTEALMKNKDRSSLNTAAVAIRTEAKDHVKI
jgi:hypothetical protein